jgi:hypothetical protein
MFTQEEAPSRLLSPQIPALWKRNTSRQCCVLIEILSLSYWALTIWCRYKLYYRSTTAPPILPNDPHIFFRVHRNHNINHVMPSRQASTSKQLGFQVCQNVLISIYHVKNIYIRSNVVCTFLVPELLPFSAYKIA